jgi:hypothetical protein
LYLPPSALVRSLKESPLLISDIATNMKSSFTLLLALQALKLASAGSSTHCAADNCARAVTGTVKGTGQVATARADCSNFMQQTVTEASRYEILDSLISSSSLSNESLRSCRNILLLKLIILTSSTSIAQQPSPIL